MCTWCHLTGKATSIACAAAVAAGHRRPPSQVGYCQGLNFVAGLLLMYLPERHAFGGLVVLMQDRGLRNYYSTDMSLIQVSVGHSTVSGRLFICCTPCPASSGQHQQRADPGAGRSAKLWRSRLFFARGVLR